MRQCDYPNDPTAFPIDHTEGEMPEEKPPCTVEVGRPPRESPSDEFHGPIEFGHERITQGWFTTRIPLPRRSRLGNGLRMEFKFRRAHSRVS